MYCKPAMTCFKYQVALAVWFWSHRIIECYTWSGYITESSNWPHPELQAALPPLYGRITFTCLEENFNKRLNYNAYVKKQRDNLYGWGTIT